MELVRRHVQCGIKQGKVSNDAESIYRTEILTITGWLMVFGDDLRKHTAPMKNPFSTR